MDEITYGENSLISISNGPILGSHTKRMEALIRHFHGAGLTLAVCADGKHLGRKIETLKPYVRALNLSFPDYVPLALRPPKEPKKRERKIRGGGQWLVVRAASFRRVASTIPISTILRSPSTTRRVAYVGQSHLHPRCCSTSRRPS